LTHAVVRLIAGVTLLMGGLLWLGLEMEPQGLWELLRRQTHDRWLWLIAWGCVFLDPVVSLLPKPTQVAALTLPDKLLHFFAYMTMTTTFLLAGVWRPGKGNGKWPEAAATITIAAAAYGGLMELLQGLVGRDAQILDEVANVLGCFAGLMLWLSLVRYQITADSTLGELD
jgi:VanZ family protein